MRKACTTVCNADCASPDGIGMPKHSWSRVSAKKFVVRQPEYATRKRKAASAESFYELLGVDWYQAEERLHRIGDKVELPRTEFSHPALPSLLIVNVQLPSEVGRIHLGQSFPAITM